MNISTERSLAIFISVVLIGVAALMFVMRYDQQHRDEQRAERALAALEAIHLQIQQGVREGVDQRFQNVVESLEEIRTIPTALETKINQRLQDIQAAIAAQQVNASPAAGNTTTAP